MNTQELFEQIEALYETFKAEHSGSTKTAHGKARKSLSFRISKKLNNKINCL